MLRVGHILLAGRQSERCQHPRQRNPQLTGFDERRVRVPMSGSPVGQDVRGELVELVDRATCAP
jgi:hypothetical protein